MSDQVLGDALVTVVKRRLGRLQGEESVVAMYDGEW